MNKEFRDASKNKQIPTNTTYGMSKGVTRHFISILKKRQKYCHKKFQFYPYFQFCPHFQIHEKSRKIKIYDCQDGTVVGIQNSLFFAILATLV